MVQSEITKRSELSIVNESAREDQVSNEGDLKSSIPASNYREYDNQLAQSSFENDEVSKEGGRSFNVSGRVLENENEDEEEE